MTSLSDSPVRLSAELLGLYRSLSAGKTVPIGLAGRMMSLYGQLTEIAVGETVNLQIEYARDSILDDNLLFSFRYRDLAQPGPTPAGWEELTRTVQDYGMSSAELSDARIVATRLLRRRDPGARHPLSRAKPANRLLGNLRTEEIVTAGRDRGRLGKGRRSDRGRQIAADYRHLQGAVFLFAGTEERNMNPQLYRPLFALAVANACD